MSGTSAFQRLRDANPVPDPAALRERPLDSSVIDPSQGVDPRATMVSFRAHQSAAENVDVKTTQGFPILGDDISMCKSGSHGASVFVQRATPTAILTQAILGANKFLPNQAAAKSERRRLRHPASYVLKIPGRTRKPGSLEFEETKPDFLFL